MMKRIAFVMTLVMVLSILAGCAGTTVVVGNCTCPTDAHVAVDTPAAIEAPAATQAGVASEGALKTGLAVTASVTESTSASADAEGKAKYDITIAAVTVDEAGVIQSCVIDSVGTEATFDATGAITSDLTMSFPQTKNELGEAYGMKANAGSQYEWNEQAAALANYAVGKTVDELKNGAVNESGYAKDADLATTATIYISGYVSTIEKAVANAQVLGAQGGDALKLAVTNRLDGATGTGIDTYVELLTDVAAVTMNGDTITSCYIDALQAKVSFDANGNITSDITTAPQTKNELGEAYGMKAYAGSQYEWNEQAAKFAAYITGKTPSEVAGIAVSEGKPSDADLATSVTIAIGGFQGLIAKVAQ